MAFKIGDLVKLKSDGPKMTVEGVGDDSIMCVWFDNKKLLRAAFAEATLEDAGKLDEILAAIKEAEKNPPTVRVKWGSEKDS